MVSVRAGRQFDIVGVVCVIMGVNWLVWFEVVSHNYLGLKPYLKCTVFTVTYDSLFVMLSDTNMLTFDGCEFILE